MDNTCEEIIFGSSDSDLSKSEIMARTKRESKKSDGKKIKPPYGFQVVGGTAVDLTEPGEIVEVNPAALEKPFPEERPRKFKSREEYKRLYRDCRIAYLDIKAQYEELEEKYKDQCCKVDLLEEIERMQKKRRKYEADKLQSKLQSCMDSSLFEI